MKRNWELKVMALLLAVVLWLVLRLNPSPSLPAFWPTTSEAR